MADYEQSVPGQMCRFWFDSCINATNENLEQQNFCRNERDAKCGNLTTKPLETSASASGSASATGTGGGDEATSTGAAPASSSTGAASANAIAFAREFGGPVLAGGMLAIFGLAL